MIDWPPRSTMAALDAADRASVAEFAQRVRNWLAESALSERITARRCRELLAICDEYDSSGD